MALDSPKRPFSKRYGYKSPAKEITIWEDAPESLRHFVLETAMEIGYAPCALRDFICSVLRTGADPSNWSEYPNVRGEVEGLVYGCEWFEFYDFVEKVYQSLSRRWSSDDHCEADERAKRFQDALNEFFTDEGIGWQMIEGEIAKRGTETFESNVHGAVEALEAAGASPPAMRATRR